MLARFDDAIDRAERRLAAGDTEGATSALNTARASIRRRLLSAVCRHESPGNSRPESGHAGTHCRRIAAAAPTGGVNAPPTPVAARTKPVDQPATAAAARGAAGRAGARTAASGLIPERNSGAARRSGGATERQSQPAAGRASTLSGSMGFKLNVFNRLLIDANLRFALDNHGVRDKVTPLIGFEYAF